MTTTKTATISCRLPTATILKVKYFASLRGITVSDWLKPIILQATQAGKRGTKHPKPLE